MQAGMIGLGVMGEGIALNLAKSGFLHAVYNRTPLKAKTLAARLNCIRCESINELARQCDVVFSCVSADQDVLEVVTAIAQSAKPGTVVVDMSTVSVNTARQAATTLAARQVEFLDAPVSGGAEGARLGKLVIMVGGKQPVLEKVRPLLEAVSQRIEYMGETGSGQATKAVNQIMAAGINQAVTEALSFAQRQSLPMDKVIDVLSGGAAGNWFLQHRGPSMTQQQFNPGFKVALHHKDLKICQEMAEQAGMALPLVEQTLADYQLLMQKGFGEEDISALYRLKMPNPAE